MRCVRWVLLPVLTVALLASTLLAEVKITGDLFNAPYKMVRLDLDGVKVGPKTRLTWKIVGQSPGDDGKPVVADMVRAGNGIYFVGPPGQYLVSLRVIDFAGEVFEEAEITITIGVPKPPTPPTPPTPPVPPTPPTPPAPPAPIPTAGLRVLIVYESGDAAKNLPLGQQHILFDKGMRDYLNNVCVAGTDGKTKEWNIWDKDADVSAAAPLWKDVWNRQANGVGEDHAGKRTVVPWMVVSNGKTGYEGPLPANPDEATALINKFK